MKKSADIHPREELERFTRRSMLEGLAGLLTMAVAGQQFVGVEASLPAPSVHVLPISHVLPVASSTSATTIIATGYDRFVDVTSFAGDRVVGLGL